MQPQTNVRALSTLHGTLALPAFLPDATRGAVRGLGPDDLAAAGVDGLVVNAFHLGRRPGAAAVRALGGVHRFTGWDGPVLSDSGGFQALSLRGAGASVTARGLRYGPAGARKTLTAEGSVTRQLGLGADVLVCLDHCTRPGAPDAEQRRSVENTVAWARAGRRAFDERTDAGGPRPLLFAVIQGGADPELRRECAGRLAEIGFDGYAFGGWPVDEGGRLVEAAALTASLAPRGAPLWALGVGSPRNLVAAAALGYGLFDCTLPTRDARRGRLFVRTGPAAAPGPEGTYAYHYAGDGRHVRDPRPVDEACSCLLCRRFSRGYLHHLFRTREPLALRLATLHNLAFYADVIAGLRKGGP